MHEQYGPVARINPYELHINDPAFFDSIYSNDKVASKWEWSARAFGLPNSMIETTDPETHRMRRGAMAPYFSMQKVIQLQPIVEDRVDVLMERLKEFRDSGKVLKLENAFAALTHSKSSRKFMRSC
jgi:cytochrome P450